MSQNKTPMSAEQKEKILKIMNISSVVFPAIFLIFAFIILPKLNHFEEKEISLIHAPMDTRCIISLQQICNYNLPYLYIKRLHLKEYLKLV
jgi:hypothetical protein